MNDDYLWDRSGKPDASVAHLEQVLGRLRWREKKRRRWPWMVAATAAAAALLIGLGIHLSPPATSWTLSVAGKAPTAVRAGQVITHGTMESDFVGEVEIEPKSRLRLLASHAGEHRMALDHGTIHALIWAPPAAFVVDTPSAKTVDLGCRYTLRVAPDGAGFLTVETGWVAFQWKHLESFIPAGAACATRPGHGPDTPHFLDAPQNLVASVARFDRTQDPQALAAVLDAARPRDALTLWHLLERTQGEERAEVFDRFAALVKLSPEVTREAVLRADPKAMDAAWNALQLGDTSWWREWKRAW
ncbi:MAG TPA: hypothetical protein VH369_05580 [Bryobacteraceae bacterium]|jgi:hypothetical protein